ncbi:cutinase family protein [Antrihabitans cavernicola]|uniref:Cutinase family protein n=1 Tax=Antrihabitans cavernicola TaxID=2495913 RepID=A0A5A7S4Y0_9NOCA|nr:cutinase family protein [Spelaeibacter cavernicola]KAA0021228.1 cutinase family protein [Spelaeibacter cavernicola]
MVLSRCEVMEPNKTVLVVGGTGECGPDDDGSRVRGLLADVTDRLDDSWTARWIPYPAEYGAPTCYDDSAAIGRARLWTALWETLDDTAGAVALLGYSQGAAIVGDVCHTVGHATSLFGHTTARIVAVGLFSDPHRNRGEIVGPDAGGEGISGPRGSWGSLRGVVSTFCAPGDVICSTDPTTSVLNLVSDLTSQITSRHPVRSIQHAIEKVQLRPKGSMFPELSSGLGGVRSAGSATPCASSSTICDQACTPITTSTR